MAERKVSVAIRGSPNLLRLAGIILALVVFVIDTFTTLEGAIAVRYVLAILMLSGTLERRGIVIVTSASAFLTIASLLGSHGVNAGLPSLLRSSVSLAAIFMTGALLVRDHASKRKLMEANDALIVGEWRFRSIFEQSPFSLWDQDYCELITVLNAMRTQGVVDLDQSTGDPGSIATTASAAGG